MVVGQDAGGVEQVAAGGGVGCSIGRQAVGLRQKGVSNKGAQQCTKAHKEMENLGGEENRGGWRHGSGFACPPPCVPSGEPLPGRGPSRVGGKRGEE